MIFWVLGQKRSGKTTFAKKLLGKNTVFLDSDWMSTLLPGLNGSTDQAYEDYIKLAELAKDIESQGFVVVVSAITPFENMRKEIQRITNCTFFYVTHDDFAGDDRYPFHPAWLEAAFIIRRREDVAKEELIA